MRPDPDDAFSPTLTAVKASSQPSCQKNDQHGEKREGYRSMPSFIPSELNPQRCDFKVGRVRERSWEIIPISKRGRSWSKANFRERIAPDGNIYTDLPGVNSFLVQARGNGFATEYNGPIASAIL